MDHVKHASGWLGLQAEGVVSLESRTLLQGFPWCLSVKESACRCGRRGFHPWSRKIPHATEQLSPYAAITVQGDHPVHSEGDQPWDFFGGTDAEAETPVLWPPHAKS